MAITTTTSRLKGRLVFYSHHDLRTAATRTRYMRIMLRISMVLDDERVFVFARRTITIRRTSIRPLPYARGPLLFLPA